MTENPQPTLSRTEIRKELEEVFYCHKLFPFWVLYYLFILCIIEIQAEIRPSK